MKTNLCLIIAIFFSFAMYSQTVIEEGPIEGTWTLAGSPYQITGTTTIEDGKTLTIEPGVLVEWQGSYSMFVEGQILAQGTADDTITFTAADTTDGFRSIRFDNTSTTNDSSRFEYCSFEYGRAHGKTPDNAGGAIGVLNYSKIVVDHCLFYRNRSLDYTDEIPSGGAIAMNNCSMRISNSKFYRNEAISGGAIICYNNSNPIIELNEFSYNTAFSPGGWGTGYGGAITCYVDASPKIIWNIFANNKAYTGGGAIGCVSRCNPEIDHNLFYGNWADWIGGAIELQDTCSAIIVNNTIVNNSSELGGGIDIFRGGEQEIRNTILWGNAAFSGDQVYIQDATSTPDFYYCDIEGGEEDIGGPGIVGKYLDCINLDPRFENIEEDDYRLTTTSPCINAGDPQMLDPDGTRCDIGVYYFHLVGLPVDKQQNSEFHIDCYPNPVTDLANISYTISVNGITELFIYDLSGRIISTLVNKQQNAGDYILTIDASDLPKGILFVNLISGNQNVTKKLLVN